MLPFTIHIEDGTPVSDQIIQSVRKAVMTGQLASGDEFPSVRAFSQELRISPTTAHKVVSSLKDDGYLASRPGIGMVVRMPEQSSRVDRLNYLQPRCKELLGEASELNLQFEDVVEALRQAAQNNNHHS